jgi:arylsulfatase A-like enzyme|tara:strand:+ start:11491 stop:13158 length:1668 start_codon:yes stop_codon:yes gene_type:complete
LYKHIWFSVAFTFTFLLLGCTDNIYDSSSEMAAETEIASAVKQPNFLIFTSDDMGYTDIGAFGGINIPTPNLDRLAMEGVRLTNFHAASTCALTRSMLMSGNGNNEAGLGAQRIAPEYEGLPGYEIHISDRVATIPERLVEAGYHTYMAGKWHLGSEVSETLPGDRGFERSFALLGGGSDHFANDKPNAFTAGYAEDGQLQNELPEDFYSTTAYVDKMIGYIDSNIEDGSPFFGWFAPTAPHWPLQAHPDWKDKFVGVFDAGYEALCWERVASAFAAGVLAEGADLDFCPKVATPWAELSEEEKLIQIRVMEVYAGMVAHLDSEFGRLLAYLEGIGELDNTYIIYHNDNGPQGGSTTQRLGVGYNNSLENIGNPDSWTTYGAGWADAWSSPYRGLKGSQFEGGTRVAAFIHSPNADEQGEGRMSNSFLTVMDIMPTLMELGGVPDNYSNHETVLPIRGKSFTSLINNQEQIIHGQDEYIALDFEGDSALTRGDWKIVRPVYDDHFQLFNISTDPSETTDLRELEPAIYLDLLTAYEAHADNIGIIRRPPRGGRDD